VGAKVGLEGIGGLALPLVLLTELLLEEVDRLLHSEGPVLAQALAIGGFRRFYEWRSSPPVISKVRDDEEIVPSS
jgi:hypothetical protein